MTSSNPNRAWRRFTAITAALLVFCALGSRESAFAQAVGRGPDVVTAYSVLDDMAQSLATAYADTEAELRKQGFGRVVDDIKSVGGLQLEDIEAESLVREVYGRAESHTAGQGERVLAHLYRTAADEFPAVREDDRFKGLRDVASI